MAAPPLLIGQGEPAEGRQDNLDVGPGRRSGSPCPCSRSRNWVRSALRCMQCLAQFIGGDARRSMLPPTSRRCEPASARRSFAHGVRCYRWVRSRRGGCASATPSAQRGALAERHLDRTRRRGVADTAPGNGGPDTTWRACGAQWRRARGIGIDRVGCRRGRIGRRGHTQSCGATLECHGRLHDAGHEPQATWMPRAKKASHPGLAMW